MDRISRYFPLLVLETVVFMSGCGGRGAAPVTPVTPSSTYTVVAISDIHFNPLADKVSPLADPALLKQLLSTDVRKWQSVFEANQNANPASPSIVGADTNYPALVLALAAIKQNIGNSPVVIFSGDMLAHDLPEWYCAITSVPPKVVTSTPYPNPCTLSTDGAAQMRTFLDNTIIFLSTQIRANVGKVPVIFVPGNIDTYSPYGTGPDATFLSDNASTLYTQLVNGSTSNEAAFQNSFTTLGSYTAEPLGSDLLVIALDSNPFAQSPYVPPLNPYAELEWLNSQLAAAQSAGQKVWLIMHVPPGANTTGTAQVVGTTTPIQITDDETSMMWQPQYQLGFMQILAQYPGLVTMIITGHTHMDEFRILPTGDVMFGLPGISPVFGNNPAFKIFTMSRATEMPMDYQSISYNQFGPPATTQYTSLYTFSTVYGATSGTSLQTSSQELYPQLTPGSALTADFINYYDSGNAATYISPKTGNIASFNMATPANWSLFGCGISQMDKQDYVGCVNTY